MTARELLSQEGGEVPLPPLSLSLCQLISCPEEAVALLVEQEVGSRRGQKSVSEVQHQRRMDIWSRLDSVEMGNATLPNCYHFPYLGIYFTADDRLDTAPPTMVLGEEADIGHAQREV